MLRAIRRLAAEAGPALLERVAAGALDQAGGFNQQQRRDERIKALLLLRHPGWRPLLERAELHPYFLGDVGFLLRFVGIHQRVEQASDTGWDDTEDQALRGELATWYARTCAIFPESASTWPVPLPDFLWERALLATGDYTLPHGRNVSLLDQGPPASWKRLLRADPGVPERQARRDVVRRVLARVDPADVIGSLQAIVAAGVTDGDAELWPGVRSRLVAEPRLIAYCGKRQLRLADDSAFLLRKVRRNGCHVDLFLYDLFLRLEALSAELDPFVRWWVADAVGVDPPSRIHLLGPDDDLALTIEKPGRNLALALEAGETAVGLAARLPGWRRNGEGRLVCRCRPDAGEAVVLELATAARAVAAPVGESMADGRDAI